MLGTFLAKSGSGNKETCERVSEITTQTPCLARFWQKVVKVTRKLANVFLRLQGYIRPRNVRVLT